MKKGSYTYGYKVPFLIVTILLVVFMFGYFRGMYYDMQTDAIVCPDEMENFLLVAESLFSENCLIYFDGERTHPGTIDANKFTQDHLDKSCFLYSDQRVSLTLDGKTIGDEMFSPVNITKPVQVYKDGTISSSSLIIQVEEVLCT